MAMSFTQLVQTFVPYYDVSTIFGWIVTIPGTDIHGLLAIYCYNFTVKG